MASGLLVRQSLLSGQIETANFSRTPPQSGHHHTIHSGTLSCIFHPHHASGRSPASFAYCPAKPRVHKHGRAQLLTSALAGESFSCTATSLSSRTSALPSCCRAPLCTSLLAHHGTLSWSSALLTPAQGIGLRFSHSRVAIKGPGLRVPSSRGRRVAAAPRALVMQPSGEHEKAENFAKRLEQVWGIRKQPQPVACETCMAQGFGECPWCRGTGFFILGDNMLCEVPSRNTSCHICDGKGTLPCDDCKGTGFRARWMEIPRKKHPEEPGRR